MTTVYFIRHAQPNYSNHCDEQRELTAKGMEDRKLVTRFLADKNVDMVLSSPCALSTLSAILRKKMICRSR